VANAYRFDVLHDLLSDEERRRVIKAFTEAVEVYLNELAEQVIRHNGGTPGSLREGNRLPDVIEGMRKPAAERSGGQDDAEDDAVGRASRQERLPTAEGDA
jgi:hypothetical protein